MAATASTPCSAKAAWAPCFAHHLAMDRKVAVKLLNRT